MYDVSIFLLLLPVQSGGEMPVLLFPLRRAPIVGLAFVLWPFLSVLTSSSPDRRNEELAFAGRGE